VGITPIRSPDPSTPPAGAPICPALAPVEARFQTPPFDDVASLAGAYESQILMNLNQGASADTLRTSLDQITFTWGDATWSPSADVFALDATGDGVAEIIVALLFRSQGYDFSDGYLWVLRCSDSEYLPIHAVYIGSPFGSETDGLRVVRDLNQDELPEIVVSWIENVGAHGYYTRRIAIFSWDGGRFSELVHPDHGGIAAYNGDMALRVGEGDGTFELVITQGVAAYYGGPQRGRTEIYAWDGAAFVLSSWSYEPPTFRFQAVQDGDLGTRFGEYDSALASYQRAIFDEDLYGWQPGGFFDPAFPTPPIPDPEERPNLEAYARYRILLLHTLRNFLPDAEVVYTTLQTKFPAGTEGHEFAVLAKVFWEAFQFSGDLSAACSEAVRHAQTEGLTKSGVLGPFYYGEESLAYEPRDLCPFLPADL
jgi:hypothetical protein